MHKRPERHTAGRHTKQCSCQSPHLVGCIIQQREQFRQKCHHAAADHTGQDGESDQLGVCILGLLHLAGSQELPHNDGNGAAHGSKHHAEQVGDGGGDIQSRHCLQTAHGITLVQDRHSRRPEHLIDHQRRTLADDIPGKRRRDPPLSVSPDDKGHSVRVGVGPDNDDHHLHHA